MTNPFEAPEERAAASSRRPIIVATWLFGMAATVTSAPLAYLLALRGTDECSFGGVFEPTVFLLVWGVCGGGGALCGAAAWAWRWRTPQVRGTGSFVGMFVPTATIALPVLPMLVMTATMAPDLTMLLAPLALVFIIGLMMAPVGAVTGWLVDRIAPPHSP